jgi:hypothetical protein
VAVSSSVDHDFARADTYIGRRNASWRASCTCTCPSIPRTDSASMIETIEPLASAGLAAAAALAAWLAHRRLVRELQASHRREQAVAHDQLATARQQISSLTKEMALLQARWVGDRVPKPAVQAVVRAPAAAPAAPAPARVEPKRPRLTLVAPSPPGPAADGHETGFPQTQPWERERR